jgi:acetyl esterase/lipase
MITRTMLSDATVIYPSHHDRRVPDASPLYGDLSALPQTLIHLGKYEALLGDNLRYADGLEKAGRNVVVHVRRGMPHVSCGLN